MRKMELRIQTFIIYWIIFFFIFGSLGKYLLSVSTSGVSCGFTEGSEYDVLECKDSVGESINGFLTYAAFISLK